MVPVNDTATLKLIGERFKLQDKDKPRVNPKHLAYYTLSWIAYIDNVYNMHKILKNKHWKYPVRIY